MKKIIEKTTWWFYSHQVISSVLLVFLGFGLITLLIYVLDIEWSYDIRDILKAILDKEFVKNLPYFLGLFITLIIPLLFIPLLMRIILEYLLFPQKISLVLSSLHDRCWEIYKLGRTWLRDTIQDVVNKVDGFRTGLLIPKEEIVQVVNALYDITEAERIYATWLLDIKHLADEEKIFLQTTHAKIRTLNKFQLYRFIISNMDFDQLFDRPTDDVILFVKQHNIDNFQLNYIPIYTFKNLLIQHAIKEEKADVLFFDGSLVFIVEIDKNTFQPMDVNGNFILSITDTNTDKEKYSRFFTDLNKNSTNVIEKIRNDASLKGTYGL